MKIENSLFFSRFEKNYRYFNGEFILNVKKDVLNSIFSTRCSIMSKKTYRLRLYSNKRVSVLDFSETFGENKIRKKKKNTTLNKYYFSRTVIDDTCKY